jgi:hypothetical protein
VKPDAEARVPRAGASEGDLIDQANADAEATVSTLWRYLYLLGQALQLFCISLVDSFPVRGVG